MIRFVPLLALALVACKKEEPAVCDAVLGDATPAAGAGPVARDTQIRVAFTGNVTDENPPSITVEGEDGAIAGTTTVDGAEIVWVADDPLPDEQEIAWSAAACSSSAEGTFVTGNADGAIDPATLEDTTYAIDLADAEWISPEGGEDLVEQFFAGAFLIGIQAASDTELDCIGASGEATSGGSWQQDPCYETIDFEPVDFTHNPYFLLVSDQVEFTVQGIPAIVHDVTISGGLNADELVDGTFSGEVDMRDYRQQLGTNGCGLIQMYAGIECVECLSDGEEECIWLEAIDVRGERIGGLTVFPNTDPEECDPDTDTTDTDGGA